MPRRMGRCRLDAGRALRHDRRDEGRPHLRDHDPSRRGVHRRLAQAARRVRRRHRGRSVAPRLHDQRDGARAHRRRRRPSSIRSTAPPIWSTRTLRTPLSPEVSFSDDPLRMLRAARFIARYNCSPCPSSIAAVTSMHGSPGDRVGRADPRRARQVDHRRAPERRLWFVIETGLADEFLPELPAMRLEQDPIHRHKDVLTHTLAVVENVRPDMRARLRLSPHATGRAVPRRRQAADPRLSSRARASRSTITTRSGRG